MQHTACTATTNTLHIAMYTPQIRVICLPSAPNKCPAYSQNCQHDINILQYFYKYEYDQLMFYKGIIAQVNTVSKYYIYIIVFQCIQICSTFCAFPVREKVEISSINAYAYFCGKYSPSTDFLKFNSLCT